MRLLLDEDIPYPLRHYFPEHDVRTVQYMGWDGKSNGELLALARDEFDALITLDQRIPHQHNITDLPPKNWSKLNDSLGPQKEGRDGQEKTHAGAGDQQAQGG